MVKTVGISDSDVARSIALVEAGFALAEKGVLKVGGTYIAKIFEGPGFTEFYVALKKKFKKTHVGKPEAIRSGSREVYIVGLEYKGSTMRP
jgi:23S rRNA (uridine2552-2'-O)-methyltransferase